MNWRSGLKKSRLRFVIWALGSLLLAAIILGAWFIFFKFPDSDNLFPLNQESLTINLVSPEDQSSFPADAAIPIQVSATSADPISRVELWVNGKLALEADPAGSSGQHILHHFHWTPLEAGSARVLVRGITAEGQTATSNPIEIQINEPAGAWLVPSADGASEVSEVILPSLTDPTLISSLPAPVSIPAQDLSPALIQKNDFSLWIGRQFSFNPTLPQAPGLDYYDQDCQPVLIIEDLSHNELGFFLYKSSPSGSAFQRAAVLKNSGDGGQISYLEPDPIPGTIYYASAFNAAGESPSAPIMIASQDPTCAPAAALPAEDEEISGDLELLDLAYFYYAFDGGGYLRYPADSQGFLTPSEYPTSLRRMVEGLASTSSVIVRRADLVVWGWSGGALVNLGSYQLEIDHTRLEVCNLGTGCTGDVASSFRSTYGELANDAEDQVREFYWSTSAPGTDAVL